MGPGLAWRSPDVFRAHGAAWRKANAGHVGLGQLKVMSAIETCRTAALGGHVERCERTARTNASPTIPAATVTCPKCQGRGGAAMARRARGGTSTGSLLSCVVFTLPASISAVAFQNKAVVYDLLFKTAAETLTTIAADPKHLGARV